MKSKMKVIWFDTWCRELDTALEIIPGLEEYPNDLYKGLIQNKSQEIKKIVLILHNNEPKSIICLKKRAYDWIPVSHYLIPGFVFPHVEGYFQKSLQAVKKNISFSFWRIANPPKINIAKLGVHEVIPTYGVNLKTEYENYWKKSNHYKNIRKVRNRCNEFNLRINYSGDLEWLMNNWEEKYRSNPKIKQVDFSDRLFVVNYLQEINKHFTFTLASDERNIVGLTLILHKNELIAQYFYRDPKFDRFSLGTYLLDQSMEWAAKNGYAKFDLGGSYPDYKKKWAPVDGGKVDMYICPFKVRMLLGLQYNYNRIMRKVLKR
jgi:hypothetical protein